MPARYFIPILLIFLFSSGRIYSQADHCNEFKTGVFQFLGSNGGYYTVIRTDSTQFERNSKQAKHSKLKVRWETDCYYILFDRVEYEWGQQPVKDADIMELGNLIYKFEKPNKFYVKTFVPGLSDTVETVFTRIDTTDYYYNLFELEGFAEYKKSRSYGQTLLGEIHSIDYYESNTFPGKYLITFETTYHDETFNKSRLLDSIVVQLRGDEHITNSNCRFNGTFDDEIVAIYTSQNEDREAKIIQAFRCNRTSGKIEKADREKVQYKESDRNRIKW